MNEIDYIVDLLTKYLEDKDSTDEDFVKLCNNYPFIKDLLDELESKENLKSAVQDYMLFFEGRAKYSEERMLNKILKESNSSKVGRRYNVRTFWTYAGVASVLLVLFLGFWKIKLTNSEHTEDVFELTADFRAGDNRAILQLADGETIELSSGHEGIVVGDNLSYSDGTLLVGNFESKETVSQLVLTTPKGGQYQVTLSDGTKVWLNAETKFIYPNRFTDRTRFVKVQGEAYFEVAKSDGKPFIVQTANEKIEVLGTHFNVNNYANESYSTVSLTEGSVKVGVVNKEPIIIKPGQQSVVEGGDVRVQQMNADDVLAWKEGEFMFDNENLESVARKLARWYDLEIEVSAGLKNISIWGSISRYDNFNKVLDIIKMTDKDIQFKVEGRRVRFMK
ncbi:FecR domain-containing protein [Sphingobacterium sp. UT-1RO-CII-1]|uniref:FecR family protein n=1 Tax=Sphingobacterium sp. UT-1RO-CII-1 TaxID=2995225 RepID=UPI00227CD5E7|nr:FecR family protein [Sphingobacterium sp. UT-1RO-CII-1]MCY4778418.1 FecR domain-containing protein [Sphingobacterium sp. UT-1RO-CII-1]